jgi:HSP20 family molecular chaperone IbpA
VFDLISRKSWPRPSLRFRSAGRMPELALLDLPLASVADEPPMELEEDEKRIRVRADLPGWEARELSVTFSDEVLRIVGEQSTAGQERSDFDRTIILGPQVDPRSARAEFADGKLTVTLDKWRQPSGVVQIPVYDGVCGFV